MFQNTQKHVSYVFSGAFRYGFVENRLASFWFYDFVFQNGELYRISIGWFGHMVVCVLLHLLVLVVISLNFLLPLLSLFQNLFELVLCEFEVLFLAVADGLEKLPLDVVFEDVGEVVFFVENSS